jgi:hypothetical protein
VLHATPTAIASNSTDRSAALTYCAGWKSRRLLAVETPLDADAEARTKRPRAQGLARPQDRNAVTKGNHHEDK